MRLMTLQVDMSKKLLSMLQKKPLKKYTKAVRQQSKTFRRLPRTRMLMRACTSRETKVAI